MKTFQLSVIAFLLASGLAFAQDVKLYDKAPSVEELQRQLTGGAPAEGKKKIRTRAIVFGDSAPAAAVPQADAAPVQTSPQPIATQQPAIQHAATAPASLQQPAAATQQPAAAPQAVQVSERAIAFPINFRVNSSEILPESIPFLESIVGLMQKDPSIRLLVEGHTDASGSVARNNTLSRERAYSVTNHLIDHYRIDPARLMPVGRGSSEPLGGTDALNPKNRRVQFRIIG